MVPEEKITARTLLAYKKRRRKIAMLTAYDYSIARLLDESKIDVVLVGDSLGNVMLGYHNTLPVTLIEMIVHTQAVARAVKRALIVADMPFGSFQKSRNDALSSAIDLVKAGAEAVKIEGAEYIDATKKIIKAGIPVMGHLGFTPQSVNILGHKVQGKKPKERSKIIKDAKALEKAGCFAVILEMVPQELAQKISRLLKIPVIGIGSGVHCDGQILVTYDMLGIYPNPPSFVKKYASVGRTIQDAVTCYVSEIKNMPL